MRVKNQTDLVGSHFEDNTNRMKTTELQPTLHNLLVLTFTFIAIDEVKGHKVYKPKYNDCLSVKPMYHLPVQCCI